MSDNLNKDIRRASSGNSLLLISFVTVVFIATYALSYLFSILPGHDSTVMNNVWYLIMYTFQYAVVIPLLLILFRKTKFGKATPKLKECFCKPKLSAAQTVKWIFISLFAVYVMSFISNYIFLFIQSLTGVELHPAQIVTENSWLSKLTNILAIMLFAPIFEEIFFRGTMLRSSARYGSWSMIIVMGIMFGLWHLNYAQTLYTAMLGVCSGFLIIKSDSVIPSMILHFIMNTIGTIQSLFLGNIDLERISSGDIKYIIENISSILPVSLTGFLVIGIIITGLVLFIVELAKNGLNGLKLPKVYTGISEGKTFAIYFSSPITIIVTLILIGITVYRAFNL